MEGDNDRRAAGEIAQVYAVVQFLCYIVCCFFITKFQNIIFLNI